MWDKILERYQNLSNYLEVELWVAFFFCILAF